MEMSTPFFSCPSCGEIAAGAPIRSLCGSKVAAAPRVEVFRNSLLLFISCLCPVRMGKGFALSLKIKRNHAIQRKVGFSPALSGWITDQGGEKPPLQCQAHYLSNGISLQRYFDLRVSLSLSSLGLSGNK